MYEVGAESGRYYSVNIPLKEGIDDASKCICNVILYTVNQFNLAAIKFSVLKVLNIRH